MTDKDYSLDALKRFLDYAAENGLLKKNTALSRKLAVNKIFSVLDSGKIDNLRNIDAKDIFNRFTNLQGANFKPASLKVYFSRLNSALVDFFSYVESPSTFKPSSPQRSSPQNKNTVKRKETSRQINSHPQAQAEPETSEDWNLHQEKHIVIPVPLRQGLTVKIHNIPPDLTEREAEKLAAIVKAYAMPKE